MLRRLHAGSNHTLMRRNMLRRRRLWTDGRLEDEIDSLRAAVSTWNRQVAQARTHIQTCALEQCEDNGAEIKRCQLRTAELQQQVRNLQKELNAVIAILGTSLNV